MKIKSFILGLIFIVGSLSAFNNQSLAQQSTSEADPDLISPDSEVDYNQLDRYLSQQRWRKANDETTLLLLEASGRRDIGWARTEDIQTLSCWDLRTIDQLWQKYSNGRFGFSPQLPIYLETGNRPGKMLSDEAYNVFGEKLGWRANNDWVIFIEDLNYSLEAPIGHFPNPRPEYSITGGRLYYSTLAEKMVQCNIGDTLSTNDSLLKK